MERLSGANHTFRVREVYKNDDLATLHGEHFIVILVQPSIPLIRNWIK